MPISNPIAISTEPPWFKYFWWSRRVTIPHPEKCSLAVISVETFHGPVCSLFNKWIKNWFSGNWTVFFKSVKLLIPFISNKEIQNRFSGKLASFFSFYDPESWIQGIGFRGNPSNVNNSPKLPET